MNHLLPRFRVASSPAHDPKPARRTECPSGKKAYATESSALEALARVRVERTASDDQRAPETAIYRCGDCPGWHLTSSDALHIGDLVEPSRGPTEGWEHYAGRLERRIAEQRAQLLSLHVLGHGAANNRAARKRIASLVVALGRMTELWQSELRSRPALVAELERVRAARRWAWRRS